MKSNLWKYIFLTLSSKDILSIFISTLEVFQFFVSLLFSSTGDVKELTLDKEVTLDWLCNGFQPMTGGVLISLISGGGFSSWDDDTTGGNLGLSSTLGNFGFGLLGPAAAGGSWLIIFVDDFSSVDVVVSIFNGGLLPTIGLLFSLSLLLLLWPWFSLEGLLGKTADLRAEK